MSITKSADEIGHELSGEAVDLLPGVPTLTNGDFARVVSAVTNSTKTTVAGVEIDGAENAHPLDLALLAHRVNNPSPLTEAMHGQIVKMNEEAQAGKDPTPLLETLYTMSEAGKSLASLVGTLTPSSAQHVADGTEVSAAGVGNASRSAAIGMA